MTEPRIITKTVEVRALVEVTVDAAAFTPEWMADWRTSFYDFHTVDQHIAHIGQLAAREMWNPEFTEGYGDRAEIAKMGIRVHVTHVEQDIQE